MLFFFTQELFMANTNFSRQCCTNSVILGFSWFSIVSVFIEKRKFLPDLFEINFTKKFCIKSNFFFYLAHSPVEQKLLIFWPQNLLELSAVLCKISVSITTSRWHLLAPDFSSWLNPNLFSFSIFFCSSNTFSLTI